MYVPEGLRNGGVTMTQLQRSFLACTLVLIASTVACGLPAGIVVETATSQTTPSATRYVSPTPLPTGTASRTPTWTAIPTFTAAPTATRTPEHTFTATPLSPATATPRPEPPTILSQAEYQVVETVILTNAGPGIAENVTLWVALVTSRPPYQEVLDSQALPSVFEVVTDEYGNQYARFEFRDVSPGGSVEATLTYQVSVSELAHEVSHCHGRMPSLYLLPETYVESDHPLVQALAREVSERHDSPCGRLKALYDYVVDHITYSSYEAGDRGAVWALDHGSGDCTEFADALLALSRASGIPARFLEGVTYREDVRADPSQIKHDWVEAYLPGHGWVPLDPTWGRLPNRRDIYFARMSPDHIIVTVGRNLSTLGGYHYFYYRWVGEQISISHQEEWEVTKW